MICMITGNGILKVRRRGSYRTQHCPLLRNVALDKHMNETTDCGDWCPMFEEYIKHKPHKKVHLLFPRCGTGAKYLIVTDEREFIEEIQEAKKDDYEYSKESARRDDTDPTGRTDL